MLNSGVRATMMKMSEDDKMLVNQLTWWRCRRYWLAVLLFLGYTVYAILQINLSILIVCMVKHHNNHTSSNTATYNASSGIFTSVNDTSVCNTNTVNVSPQHEDGEFEWDKQLQGILLGGYYWGYGSGSQVLGGWLAQRYGARKVITLGLLPMAVSNILSPVVVRISPYLFLALRIISGATSGVMFPSAPVFWSRWSPPDEWSRLLSSSYTGNTFGHSVAFPINGLLCKYGGWEMPFYLLGSVCLAWCIAWILLSRDSPSEMPGITEAEKVYIETCIGGMVTSKRKYKTPWRRMFKSHAVLACVSCHMMCNFFFYMLITQVPTYLSEVMNFDIASNGFFSFLPFFIMVVLIMPVGALSDWLSSREYLSLGAVRKLMNSVGMVLPAIFLLALAYLPCSDQTTGVALLTAAVALFAFCYSGHLVNMADIALMHSGILVGFSNSFASVPGIIMPYVVAYVTKQGTQAEWRTAFLIAIVFNIAGAVVFLIFSSGVAQPWALPELNITATLETRDKSMQDNEVHIAFIESDTSLTDSQTKECSEGESLLTDVRTTASDFEPVTKQERML